VHEVTLQSLRLWSFRRASLLSNQDPRANKKDTGQQKTQNYRVLLHLIAFVPNRVEAGTLKVSLLRDCSAFYLSLADDFCVFLMVNRPCRALQSR